MRRLSALSAALTATALAYTNSAAAAVAPEAPLAPINTSLLQWHPGAPISIDDVLLAPSASAGQKGAAFEWANANNVQAYVLWDKFFAAAEYAPGSNTAGEAPLAETRASFGVMTPGLGLGLSLAYRDSTVDDSDSTVPKSSHHYTFSQARLFGSVGIQGMDLYGSLVWAKYPKATVTSGDNVTDRYDSVMLQVGARQAPTVGAEGLAWNVYVTPGFLYQRNHSSDTAGNYTWLLNLDGQLGYVFQVDGIEFLPGVDAYWHHKNAVSPDYLNTFGVSPYAAISVPLFEHWTLKGGARFRAEQTFNDYKKGNNTSYADEGIISNTVGSVGLRYARDRWALEGQLANGFLAGGPYFISGNDNNKSDLVASLGFTVNLK